MKRKICDNVCKINVRDSWNLQLLLHTATICVESIMTNWKWLNLNWYCAIIKMRIRRFLSAAWGGGFVLIIETFLGSVESRFSFNLNSKKIFNLNWHLIRSFAALNYISIAQKNVKIEVLPWHHKLFPKNQASTNFHEKLFCQNFLSQLFRSHTP